MVSSFDYLNALAALEAPCGVIAVTADAGWCLACLPENAKALQRLRQEADVSDPLTLLSHSREAMSPYVGEMTLIQAAGFQELMKAHWPGLLTCEVPAAPGTLAGESIVRIRIPDYPFLTEFIQLLPEQVLVALPYPDGILNQRADYVLEGPGVSEDVRDTVVDINEEGKRTILQQGSLHIERCGEK